MTLTLEPVQTDEQLEQLASIADEIWHEYWTDRIGEAQTDYMIKMFHSIDAMKHDINERNYRYWFLIDSSGNTVGYTGGAVEELVGDTQKDAAITHSQVVNERWPKRFFISKIYLYAHERGKHYASRVIEFYEDLCKTENLPAMYLTVNRENELGVRAYLGRGFEIVEEVDNPIGDGFVMYDYIMAKEIAN